MPSFDEPSVRCRRWVTATLELQRGGPDKLDRKSAYYLLSTFDDGELSTELFASNRKDFADMARILREGLSRGVPMTLVTCSVFHGIKGWYDLDLKEALEAIARRLDDWGTG